MIVTAAMTVAEVIIGSRESGVVWIHRNLARGTGTWTMSPTGLQGVFGDVRVDRGTGDIWAMADDPNVKFEKYARGQLSVKGVSNATKINPFATHYCSTYALANGKIFISGSNNNFSAGEADRFAYLDLAAAPTAGAPTAGVNVFVATGSPSTRMLAADDAGNAYAVAQGSDGKIHIDRVLAGTLTAADSVVVANEGRYPNMAVTNDGFAVVAYSIRPMSTSSTYVTIHKY